METSSNLKTLQIERNKTRMGWNLTAVLLNSVLEVFAKISCSKSTARILKKNHWWNP